VKIPECNENIRRINIMLGDANTSSVARSKIAKKKSLEAVAL
jgi:V/A-type H+-transporting ATPase subunit D